MRPLGRGPPRAALLTRRQSRPWLCPRAGLGAACPEPAAEAASAPAPAAEEWAAEPAPEPASWPERLADLVTPLWRLDYEQQLRVKAEALRGLLQRLEERLRALGSPPAHAGALCSRLQPFRASPLIDGYRNKSNFAVGRGPDGRPRTVGYVLGAREARPVCVPAGHLKHLPEKHRQVARCYQAFLRQSPLEPYAEAPGGGPGRGHWHELTVRSAARGQTMAVVAFHPQQLRPEQLGAAQEQLRSFFSRGPGAACGLSSLYWQEAAPAGPAPPPPPPRFRLLAGEPHLLEELPGLRVRVSPGAFFQLNAAAAPLLYGALAELGGLDGRTRLLDLSQGTGATGLWLARRAAHVLCGGLPGPAADDARWTAAFNGITNWACRDPPAPGAAPPLPGAPEAPEAGRLAALVDPSRTGLSLPAVRALRGCGALRTLLFVSCYPDGKAKRNFVELCCPPDPGKELLGEPFVLRQAVPVDMFPHTAHYELVLLFTR